MITVLPLSACANSTSDPGAQSSSAAETDTATDAGTASAETKGAPASMSEEDIAAITTITINGHDLVLPFDYAELKEQGFSVNDAIPEETDESTTIEPHSTITSQFSTGDGVFDILSQNGTDKAAKITESEIIAVKLSRFYRSDCDIEFEYDGITWDSSVDEIKEILGEPISEEVLNDQHLIGYSFVRDEFSNISVSFVADSEKLFSFAISIDYLSMTAL